MIEHEDRDQAEKNIEVEKPKLEKITRRSLKNIYFSQPPQKMPQRKQTVMK